MLGTIEQAVIRATVEVDVRQLVTRDIENQLERIAGVAISEIRF